MPKIMQTGTMYAVLIGAETDGQENQRKRNGKGLAILIRVEVLF